MSELYPDAASFVNPSGALALSTGAASFYRWLYRWHSQTGRVDASTGYFARKQGKTERTIYRWLAELRAAAFISSEVDTGIERRVVPLAVPPCLLSGRSRGVSSVPKQAPKPIPKQAPNDSDKGLLYEVKAEKPEAALSGVVSGVLSGVVSGVLPVIDAYTQDASTHRGTEAEAATGVVADLISEGVSASVAARLVQEVGEQPVREQLAALPFRSARDKAAVIVAAVRNRWALPAAFVQVVDRKRKETQEASVRASRAALEGKRAEQRSNASVAFHGLPEEARSALLSEACEALRLELPAVWAMMQRRGPEARSEWITGRAVRLLASRSSVS